MRAIIFNDKQNFDGCLNLVNRKFKDGKRRFWNFNKYLPFLFNKVGMLFKEKFNQSELKLIKTFFYTGRYNYKVINNAKWASYN